jgi:hypothetical protein
MLMVVVLLFGSKSHVTWVELKTFGGFVQAKKHKKLTHFFLTIDSGA